MEIARIEVSGAVASVRYRDQIPAGLVGGIVNVVYSDTIWKGLTKTVVFKGGAETRDVVSEESAVTIPHETVAEPGKRLYVGFYGTDTDGTLVIPTIWADLGMIRDATDPSGDVSTDPSLPVYAQLAQQIGDLRDQVENMSPGSPGGGTGGGQDGFSPIASVAQTADGAVITITDKKGTTTATVKNGRDGDDGDDGGHYTPTVTQPSETTMQIGWTPSKANMPAVQPVKITLPVNPDYGGNVAYDEAQNLTDEQKAQARENIGAQPKGNYLTEVPEGYAKKEDIPTDEEIIQLIEEHAPESSGGGIAVTGAHVGQTIKIAAVDANGVPTAWEPAYFPTSGGDGSGGGTRWEPLVNEVWQRNREFRFAEYNAETLTYTFPDGTFTDDEIGTEILTQLVLDPNSLPDKHTNSISYITKLTPISGSQATIPSAQVDTLNGKNYWFEVPTGLSIKGVNARKIRVRWDGNVENSFQNLYKGQFAYGMPTSQSAHAVGYIQCHLIRSIADIELELIDPYVVSGHQNAYIYATSSNATYHKKWYQSYAPVMQEITNANEKKWAYSADGYMFKELHWITIPWIGSSPIFFIGNGTRIYVAREVEA